MQSPLDWVRRSTLGRRIALAMFLALAAVQAQAFLQIWTFSKPEIRMLGTRWLAQTAQNAAQAVFSAPVQSRSSVSEQLSRDGIIEVKWHAAGQPIEADARNDVLARRLAATLDELLQIDRTAFRIEVSKLFQFFPNKGMKVEVVPDTVRAELGSRPVRLNEPEVLSPANLKIALQGGDGTWITVTPIGIRETGWLLQPPLTPLLAGGLIIAIVSIVIARSLVSPLDRLVAAAHRLGSARELVEVRPEGLAEFGAVAEAFVDMQKKLLRFVDDRTQMLAAISHDLRSSLTRLRLASEEVAEERDRDALAREIGEMTAMLDSTLAFARGEAHRPPSERIDLATLLISLVDNATDDGAECEYSGPDHADLVGDPISLKRAFKNLIDNALKYGHSAQVELVIEEGAITVQVSDKGPGIPAERSQEALMPFRRLDAARGGAVPGAGLGLTIANDVVLAHGGSLALMAAAGGGLCVAIRLPAVATSRER